MTLKIWTSWIPVQTKQQRGQAKDVQLQNLTTIKNFERQSSRGIF